MMMTTMQYRPFQFEAHGNELWLTCHGASINLSNYVKDRPAIIRSNMEAAIEEQLTLIRTGKAT